MSIAAEFFSIYPGLDRAIGKNEVLKKLDPNNKRASKNQTVHTDYNEARWEAHLEGKEGLGVIPITDDATCGWGAIDVDIYPLDLPELEQKVKSFNFPFAIIRSKSGGAHLTVYFSEMQPCTKVRSKLAEISFVLGLGDREIYPKQVKLANKQDVGNWLNMPYFASDKTERYAVIDGQPATVVQFLEYVKSIRLDSIEDLDVPQIEEVLPDGPPCLQRMILNKAGPGERNNVLFNLGVYCRLKFESNWEQEIENFNREVIDPPLSHREVGSIIKSLEKKNYAFTCNNPPICNHCNREACKGREFGIVAFQHVDVGIVLDSISKMMSEPPMWVLSLEGVRTEIETDELLDQNKFRKVCVNAINKIPGRMKAEEWDKFVRNKLSDIEILDMPIETRSSELAFNLIGKYFESTPPARTPGDIAMGRWLSTGAELYVRGSDYISFLERHGIDIDPRRLWSILISKGIRTSIYMNFEVWVIPPSVYKLEDKQTKYNLPPKEIGVSF